MLSNEKEYAISAYVSEKISPIQFILNDMSAGKDYVYDFIAQYSPFNYLETINLEKDTDAKVDEFIATVIKKYNQFVN